MSTQTNSILNAVNEFSALVGAVPLPQAQLVSGALTLGSKLATKLISAWETTQAEHGQTLQDWLAPLSYAHKTYADYVGASAGGDAIVAPSEGVIHATASDLLAAAMSGHIPDWFTTAERSAVTKIQA